MKRILLLFFTLLTALNSYSQPITVNTTTYTVPQLVQDILFTPTTGNTSCVGTISNITWSTGSNFGSSNGIGYFTNTNPGFPLSSGVILSTGNVANAPGPNNSLQSSGNNAWPGDQDLFDYMLGLGIVNNTNDYHNASILEFDFVPLTNQMSFDFLFASEEYGIFQCSYSDAFAFFLTNVTTGSAPVNLALVPGTNTPISVTTIRDNSELPTCDESNVAYFGSNNQGPAASSAAINFNGQTTVMTATSAVIPSNTYHIKLVISDLDDNSWDSAVFLGAGSFNIGTPDISGTGEFNGTTDFTIAGNTAVCGSKTIVAQAGSAAIPGATYAWTLGGNPIGTNSHTLSITQPGIYGVTITYPGGCQQSDTMTVEYLPSLSIGTPNNLTQCSAPFNLTANTPLIQNGLTNPVTYHHSLFDAQQQASPISNANAANYNGTDGEVIYGSIEDFVTGCINTTQFTLHLDSSLCITAPIPGTPPDMYAYETSPNSGVAQFDLTTQTGIVYSTNLPSNFTVTYYLSAADANSGSNPITNLATFQNTSNPQRIYAVISDIAHPASFAVTSFQLFVVALPNVTISGPSAVCAGDTATITFTGTPNAIVDYTFNGNPAQVTLLPNGTNTVVSPPLVLPANYNLVSATITTPAGTTTQPELGSVTVNIAYPPSINTPTDYVVCDDSLNNDGIYCGFNLHSKDSEVTSSATVTVTYHQTLTDAQTGGNPLTSPYCNNANPQTIYVRAFDASAPACYSVTSFNLIVNPIPIPNPVITDYELCDYNNPGDGVEIFDLGTKSAEIANGQLNVTVTYYATLSDAQNQTSPLSNFYTNTSSPQKIWINIRDIATGCNTTSSFNLIVNPLPNAATPPTLFQCSNGFTLNAVFNLTVNEANVTGGVTGLTLSYYHTLADAQSGNPSLAIPTPSTYLGNDNEIVYIRVVDGKGCYTTTTQLLRVTQGPVAVTPTPLQYCDPNNDGFGEFNLNDATNQITGGSVPAGVSVSYHETPDDSYIGANPIPLSVLYNNIQPWSQILYVRVYYTLTGCANYVQLKLNVNPTPEAVTPTDYQVCDDTAPAHYEPFNLTTKIPEILGSINPATVTVTFYHNFADAQTPANSIIGTASYVNATPDTETLYVRVEFIATGCYDIVPLNLIVNPLPNSMQPNYPQYSLCDNNQSAGDIGYEVFDLASQIPTIQMGQSNMEVRFYISLGDAQNGTNQIMNLMYRNSIQYVQTLGIRIINPTTGCYVISTIDIRVEPLPTLIPPTTPYTLCDQNQDGFTTFDLTLMLPGLLGTPAGNYSVSFHETMADAQANGTTIPNPTSYVNINPFTQTIYVRAEDNITHCVSILPVIINVNPSPIAPSFLNDIVLCDQDSNPQSASTFVNLTVRTPDVLAQQPLPAANYLVTYYNSLGAAQAGTAPIIPATAYPGSNGDTIWVRVENTTTHCYNIGTFHLVINTPLLLITPTPLNLCDDDASPNNLFHVFNLTVKDTQINQGTGYTVTYYPSLTDAQNHTNVITTPGAYQNIIPAVQTLGVEVTTTAGCKSITTLDIRVLPIPTPNTNPPALAPKCDDTNPGDMMEVFDLTVNSGYIMNGAPNLTLHYFTSLADALVPQNQIPNPAAANVGGNVWIRVENTQVDYLGHNCYVLVEQPLTVNPLPTVIQPLAPFRVCDNDADGLAPFNLNDPTLAPQILGTATTGQQPSAYTITYYLTAANAASGTAPLVSPYTNVTPNSQNIYIRVVNNATGCVNATGVLTLAVEQQALATGPQTFSDCDNYNDPYDGIHQVDLTQFESAILNGQNPAVFLVSYYTSLADAIAGTGALTAAQAQAYVTHPDTDTVWVKVENSSNSITPLCYAITTININVERYPNPIINTPNGVNTICVDFITDNVIRPLTLDSGITNTANYSFEWFESANPTTVIGTNPTYTVDTSATGGGTRTYSVHVTSNTPLACDTTSATFDVIQSGPAVIPAGTVGYTVTDAFSNSQIVTVTVTGYGTYEYSLDDGPRQASNVFENVSLGSHVVHVWDTEGGVAYSCEELIINDVQIIDYPHYFTPNGDGIHDTWNIVGLGGQPNAKIYIFDRYGKLMKQISSTGQGWDGTFNGHLLPSDDYWFTVDFIENSTAKQFKAHFSLKR